MRKILILGAGKSSISLIDYLIEHSTEQNWVIIVADHTIESALLKTYGRPNTSAIGGDLTDNTHRHTLLVGADIVISMLPAALHTMVAKDCLTLGKNLVTPSYISPAMMEMNEEVTAKGLIFLNEMGLDPGIDHMSAMQIIERLKEEGKTITAFESHCGGLVAPQCDDNPWNYKFSWNPRNVILAGQGEGSIRYLKEGQIKLVPYFNLFTRTENIELEDWGKFETYPNRDSMKYLPEYGLEGVRTMYRGTLRRQGYSSAWNCLVKLGICDDITQVDLPDGITFAEFMPRFLDVHHHRNVAFDTAEYLRVSMHSPEFEKLKWLGLFDNTPIGLTEGTPAKVIQKLLEKKWAMNPGDKDMVVMVHRINYMEDGIERQLTSWLGLTGKDEEHTAMALTVGLPIAIAVKLLLNGQITRKGVIMPKYADIYNPVLDELKQYGITFTEKVTTL